MHIRVCVCMYMCVCEYLGALGRVELSRVELSSPFFVSLFSFPFSLFPFPFPFFPFLLPFFDCLRRKQTGGEQGNEQKMATKEQGNTVKVSWMESISRELLRWMEYVSCWIDPKKSDVARDRDA